MCGHFKLGMSDQLLFIGSRCIHILHKGSESVPADVRCIDMGAVFLEWVEVQRLQRWVIYLASELLCRQVSEEVLFFSEVHKERSDLRGDGDDTVLAGISLNTGDEVTIFPVVVLGHSAEHLTQAHAGVAEDEDILDVWNCVNRLPHKVYLLLGEGNLLVKPICSVISATWLLRPVTST